MSCPEYSTLCFKNFEEKNRRITFTRLLSAGLTPSHKLSLLQCTLAGPCYFSERKKKNHNFDLRTLRELFMLKIRFLGVILTKLELEFRAGIRFQKFYSLNRP